MDKVIFTELAEIADILEVSGSIASMAYEADGFHVDACPYGSMSFSKAAAQLMASESAPEDAAIVFNNSSTFYDASMHLRALGAIGPSTLSLSVHVPSVLYDGPSSPVSRLVEMASRSDSVSIVWSEPPCAGLQGCGENLLSADGTALRSDLPMPESNISRMIASMDSCAAERIASIAVGGDVFEYNPGLSYDDAVNFLFHGADHERYGRIAKPASPDFPAHCEFKDMGTVIMDTVRMVDFPNKARFVEAAAIRKAMLAELERTANGIATIWSKTLGIKAPFVKTGYGHGSESEWKAYAAQGLRKLSVLGDEAGIGSLIQAYLAGVPMDDLLHA